MEASCGVQWALNLVQKFNSAPCVSPRPFAPSTTPTVIQPSYDYLVAVSNQPLHKSSVISIQSTWPTVKQSQTAGKVSGNLQNQRFKVKCSDFIFWLSELIICREAASRHQKSESSSQKPSSTSNTAVSQAVSIQEQLYSESAGTSFPSGKQHPYSYTPLSAKSSISPGFNRAHAEENGSSCLSTPLPQGRASAFCRAGGTLGR